MGVGEAIGFSNSYNPQDVQGWLDDQGHYKVPQSIWPASQCKFKKDVDQGSVASADDVVSISDSSQSSHSSESSSHTVWTSATDPAEIFLDDEEKDEQLSRCSNGSHTVEPQEYLLKGLHTKDEASGRNRLPASQIYQSVKPDSSVHPRPSACSRISSQGSTQPYAGEVPAERLVHKTSSRRSTCIGKSLSGPCKLKRDTDITEHFVALLVCFATKLVTAIWPMSACPPMSSTCFNGAGVLPLRVFIQETLRRSKTSYSTLQVALYYLVLLKAKLPCARTESETSDEACRERSPCRAMQCGRRMFLSALMLASKYLQDRNYSARAWSKISGLRSNEINENEREYLQIIDYELHVPKESFDVWSKIVLSLSRACKEQPQCRLGSPGSGYSPPGNGSSNSLADMVSQVDLEEENGPHVFTDVWWTDVINQLGPGLVKDVKLADDFLLRNLPADQMAQVSACRLEKQTKESVHAIPATTPPVYDLNFSDSFKSSAARQEPSTPQTPTEMSPARGSVLPMRPHLRNLPTPQTTPRVADNFQWSSNCNRPSLRCSASVDALRNMRKQCFMNANLERCPPPRPHCDALPSMRSLLRPAETSREHSNRSVYTASPLSVVSETPPLTSRSRSSSISSSSSWSSTMRSKDSGSEQFSSPLARVFSSSDENVKPPSTTLLRPDTSFSKFCDEGYGSGEEPFGKGSKHPFATSSEFDALQALMSLSSHSETPSQSVTPTPQRLAEQGILAMRPINSSPRGHKRTLSKTNENLQTHVRRTLADPRMVCNVIEDPIAPLYDNTPKQWQVPARSWAEPRRALPNNMDNKRVASYCSIQQFASAPNLAAQYLKDTIITAS